MCNSAAIQAAVDLLYKPSLACHALQHGICGDSLERYNTPAEVRFTTACLLGSSMAVNRFADSSNAGKYADASPTAVSPYPQLHSINEHELTAAA